MCVCARVCVCVPATELGSQLLIRVRALVRQQQPFVSARKMLPMLRLIVTLLLLLFTLTVLGEEDPTAAAAAVKEKDVNEESSKPSEGAKRASDPNNPWTRMPDWHFGAPYLYPGFYPLHPGSATFPGVPQQPLSPLMSMMFPAHMAQSGHPWGVAPHHWPQVTYPGYPPYPVPVHPVTPLMGAMFPAHTAHVWHPWEAPHYHAPYPAYPGYPIHSDHFHQHTMSPLMGMMMHAHPVEAHPWGAPVYGVHFPAVPTSPTPGQAFRWRYPEYYPYHYGHIHGPLHTSATFYPHKPQGGYCNFDQTFLCWGMAYCIQPKALCDGVYDCPNHFDELPHLCIEGRRPSVESITQFLDDQGWIKSNVFKIEQTSKAIAEVLKSAESVEELRWKLGLDEEHVNNTRDALQAVMDNESKPLEDLGMAATNFETVKYFFKTLLDTGLRTST